jgi:hypothetical protein
VVWVVHPKFRGVVQIEMGRIEIINVVPVPPLAPSVIVVVQNVLRQNLIAVIPKALGE